MNKGLFYHIVVSILYIISILYITNGVDIPVYYRILIVIGFIFTNIFTMIFVEDTNAYKEKI